MPITHHRARVLAALAAALAASPPAEQEALKEAIEAYAYKYHRGNAFTGQARSPLLDDICETMAEAVGAYPGLQRQLELEAE